jgi:hypothetical protein
MLDLVEDGSTWAEVVELAHRIEAAGATIINTGMFPSQACHNYIIVFLEFYVFYLFLLYWLGLCVLRMTPRMFFVTHCHIVNSK